MIEKLKLEIPVLLPDNGRCPDCMQRLHQALDLHKGIVEAHLDRNSRSSRLCLHYDAALISLAQAERLARQEGVNIQQRYRHRELRVNGMDCAKCALKLEKSVSRLNGVLRAAVDFASARMRVEYDVGQVDEAAIVQRVRRLGYDASVKDDSVPQDEPSGVVGFLSFLMQQRRAVWTLGGGLLIFMGFAFAVSGLSNSLSYACYATAIAVAGFRVARRGLTAAWINRQLDVNFLMTVAVFGAMAIGAWEEGALVVFLFNLGKTLEEYTVDRARRSIRALMELAPAEAIRLTNPEQRVAVQELTVGDRILVRPGERVPMDGVVRQGESTVDQAPITGESIPIRMQSGAQVFAGSINGGGALEIEVTRLAEDNTISRLINMVEEAQTRKASSQRWVDAFARFYTPIVVGLAMVIAIVPPLFLGEPFLRTAAGNGWVYRALSLLIIACPCALMVSTPVSLVSGITSAARQGVLFKGGAYLEATGDLQVMAFDKTGTLTSGEPEVTDVIPSSLLEHPASRRRQIDDRERENDLLRLAATAEAVSEHPLAQAIVRAAQHRDILFAPARESAALTGRGVRATVDETQIYVGSQTLFGELGICIPEKLASRGNALEEEGKTVMFVASTTDGSPAIAGLVAVTDTVRADARESIAALKRGGIRHTVMLTGDNERTAAAVAAYVGVDSFRADLTPEEKVTVIDKLLTEYGQVAMVGDGIIDAPALARATVGIGMGGSGSDQTLETADVVLMADALSKLPFAVRLSRHTLEIVRQNIAFSLLVKAALVALAIPGMATLWMAVLADAGASLLVILNGMRLLRSRP